MSEQERLEGAVAYIVNERELLINLGRDDGVRVGTRFAIAVKDAIEVRDPVTKEVLGSTPLVKTLVKVVRIDAAHLCTARTFRTFSSGNALFNFATRESRQETFDVNVESIDSTLSEWDLQVSIGDAALEAVGDEYE